MKNDRTLGEISISKVDLDAVRYVGGSTTHGTALASGQATAMPRWTARCTSTSTPPKILRTPISVTGVVDYSKIVDADGNPMAHHNPRQQWAVGV